MKIKVSTNFSSESSNLVCTRNTQELLIYADPVFFSLINMKEKYTGITYRLQSYHFDFVSGSCAFHAKAVISSSKQKPLIKPFDQFSELPDK